MKTLRVKASKEYDVIITDSYSGLNDKIKEVFFGQRLLILCDDNTEKFVLQKVKEKLSDYELYTFTVKSGEESKSANNFIEILNYLAKNKFTRVDGVVALGGGVVGDLAGFVSASYMRGINYIQLPTTLLSFVDSSVGGKTAINLAEGKNLAGAFYQPSVCYINVSVLKTLPEKEMLCGYGEIVKYAYLSETVSFDLIKNGSLEDIIYECLKVKAEVVKEDEFELGKRALLNLGHTVGHAIETLSNFTLSHGLCVAKGIGKIIEVSKKYYSLNSETVLKLKNLLSAFPFDLDIEFSNSAIAKKMLSDKKVKNDYVNLVLIKDVGDVRIEKINVSDLEKIL